MDAASAVKANKLVDGFGAERLLLGRVVQPTGESPVAKGAPYPAARVMEDRFSPHRRRPGTSRADALSAGWREFLLRTGLGEFTTRPLRHHLDWPKYDGVGDVNAVTSVTCTR